MHTLTLSVLDGTYAICRLDKGSPVPGWALEGEVFSITRTHDELSVVCQQDAIPVGVRCDRGWKCFKVEGPLPFDVVGSSLPSPCRWRRRISRSSFSPRTIPTTSWSRTPAWIRRSAPCQRKDTA